MNHEPFEKWILDEIELSREQHMVFKQHLERCPDCSGLYRTWKGVEQTLKDAPIISAPSSFTENWRVNLAVRKRAQEKRQARTFIISLLSGIAAILLAGAILFLPDFSLISTTARTVALIVSLVAAIGDFWSIMFKLLQAIPTRLLIITGTFVSSWILLACGIWVISVWKLAIKKGSTK